MLRTACLHSQSGGEGEGGVMVVLLGVEPHVVGVEAEAEVHEGRRDRGFWAKGIWRGQYADWTWSLHLTFE